MIDVAKGKLNDDIQGYWNTYYCQNRIFSYDGKTFGKYCKNRPCTLCSSIRKAEIINKYLPVIQAWEQPYFITLTIKACYKNKLRIMLKGCIRAFRQINAKYRKQNNRGKGTRLIGVKSLECNFNPITKTYNPHFHLIVANKKIAEILIKEWLAKWTSKYTTRPAQNMRPINDLVKDLIETIKYGSKIFTEPDLNKKSMLKGNRDVYAAALYNIFHAMKGLRIFDRFGFNLPKSGKERVPARIITHFQEWVHIAKYHDWVSPETDATLTGFVLNAKLKDLLENHTDMERE